MNAPKVDVHGILDRAGANPDAPEGSQAWALALVDVVVAELIEAMSDYYHGYMVDEADDDGVEFTGCTQDQHEKAARVKHAIARFRSEP